MSNIGAVHAVVEYVSGKSKAFDGQRLSSHSWKTQKDTGVKRTSVCVSLPTIKKSEIVENLDTLIPMIRAHLESVQDKMIKEKLESKEGQEGKVTMVLDSEINIAAMIAWNTPEASTNRLTKEVVAAWFTENVEESLMLALADKLGVGEVPTDAESMQIEKITNEFKNKVSGLAGGKTSYAPEIARAVRKCVELAPAGDELTSKLIARLDKMITAPVGIDLLDAL